MTRTRRRRRGRIGANAPQLTRRTHRRGHRRGGAWYNFWRKQDAIAPQPVPPPPPQKQPEKSWRNWLTRKRPQQVAPIPIPASMVVTKPSNFPATTATQFLQNPPATNLRAYLQLVCSNTHYCMAFGRDTDRITAFFDGFTNFKYATRPARQLSRGANGVVTEITFERDGLRASTVLKTAQHADSDNLFLEAFNGIRYINAWNAYYPCFLITYAAMQYIPQRVQGGKGRQKFNTLYRALSGAVEYNFVAGELQRNLRVIPATFDQIPATCVDSQFNAILLQYVHRPMTLHTWCLMFRVNVMSMSMELVAILFQVYAALASLNARYGFTHYDLHAANVILYEIPDHKYVTMVYDNVAGFGADPITFHTRWIAKIIDYGRCYFPTNAEYYTYVCDASEACGGRANVHGNGQFECGYDKGYGYFSDRGQASQGFIASRLPNRSHDLRLLAWFQVNQAAILPRHPAIIALKRLLQSVVYLEKHGTPEVETPDTTAADFASITASKVDASTGRLPPIQTVEEAFWALTWIVGHAEYFATLNANMITHLVGQAGTMHVDASGQTMVAYVAAGTGSASGTLAEDFAAVDESIGSATASVGSAISGEFF